MDDANIVQLYWDRNEQAIPATADKYESYCTSIAKNILGNHEDTEECVNDTSWPDRLFLCADRYSRRRCRPCRPR